MKAGAYKLITQQQNVGKLHINSHLYTSEQLLTSFPGRIFKVIHIFPFNNALCRTLFHTVPQANLSTRNFPLSVKELRKRTGIIDGGDNYLLATTLANEEKVFILCKKAIINSD